MNAQTIESPEIVEPVGAVEATIETPAIEPRKSRFASALAYVQAAPKWSKLAVPALAVALAGYGYVQHGGNAGDDVHQAAMVSPNGQPNMPVAYNPNHGPAYGNHGRGDGYGNGYGNGNASGSFGFSMGGSMSGHGSGRGNGYGDGWGNNHYNGNYY